MTKTARGTLALRLYYFSALGVGGVYLPFFPRWLEARGMVGVKLGLVAAAGPAMGIVTPTVIGVIADTLKLREGLLQLACAGSLMTFGALAVAAAAGMPLGMGVLFLATLIFAFFRSPMGFVADLVALELAPAAGTTYGRLRLWGSFGFLVAALLAARYVDPRNAVVLPAVTAVVTFGALMASLRLPSRAELPHHRGERRGARRLLATGSFRLFLLAVFLGQCGHVAYDLCFSIHLFDLGVSRMTIGVAWALGTAAEVIMMAYAAPLFRAFSPVSLFAFALGGRVVPLDSARCGALAGGRSLAPATSRILFRPGLDCFGRLRVAALSFPHPRHRARPLLDGARRWICDRNGRLGVGVSAHGRRNCVWMRSVRFGERVRLRGAARTQATP